jgi:lipopolysaccharide export system protein LptA
MIPGATAHPRSGTGRRSPGLLWAAVALCTAPAGASAQAVCQVVSSERVNAVTLFTGTRLIFASRPDVECDDGTRIQADSAEVNEGAGVSRFFGNFRFRDPTRSLTSGFAEFYDQQDRLLAWQDVVLTQSADGSVMRGDTLEYYRASDFIQEDLLSMRGGRVRSTLPPRAGTGAPYDVESDRLVIQGEDRVTATGMVSVVRDSLRAWGDTMTFNPDTDRLRLGGLARIEGETYELTGGVIDLLVPADTLREVLAQRNPVLTTEGMVLTAPREIRIDLEAGEIERLVAVGDPPPASPEGAGSPEGALRAPRPRAEAEDFVLVGDSLDVAVPGGALERVVAIGDARGESLREPASEAEQLELEALPEILRGEWMEGDTIIATFVPNEPTTDSLSIPLDMSMAEPSAPDSGEARYRLDRLVALGNARSLYRVAPSDSAEAASGRRALHYVTGREITVLLVDGEVNRMEVTDPAGVHLEPAVRRASGPAPADTTFPPDSVSGLPNPTDPSPPSGEPPPGDTPSSAPSDPSPAAPGRRP